LSNESPHIHHSGCATFIVRQRLILLKSLNMTAVHGPVITRHLTNFQAVSRLGFSSGASCSKHKTISARSLLLLLTNILVNQTCSASAASSLTRSLLWNSQTVWPVYNTSLCTRISTNVLWLEYKPPACYCLRSPPDKATRICHIRGPGIIAMPESEVSHSSWLIRTSIIHICLHDCIQSDLR
jgi:hypothetical protein